MYFVNGFQLQYWYFLSFKVINSLIRPDIISFVAVSAKNRLFKISKNMLLLLTHAIKSKNQKTSIRIDFYGALFNSEIK